jgi:membrane-associated phospholipid phosphatase
MRIGADKHHAIDVLTGAAAGAAVGWYVPALVRRGKRAVHHSFRCNLRSARPPA